MKNSVFMQKRLLFVFIFLFVTNNLFTAITPQPTPPATPAIPGVPVKAKKQALVSPDLKTWAHACFQEPEFSSMVQMVDDKTYTTPLDAQELKKTLEAWIQDKKNELITKSDLWVNKDALSEDDFFTLGGSGLNPEITRNSGLLETLEIALEENLASKDPKLSEKKKELRTHDIKKRMGELKEIIKKESDSLNQQLQKDPNILLKFLQKKQYAHPFAQKILIKPGDKVFIMGDIHGSIHSLLRNLLRMVELGYLDENFKITQPNMHMIFLGDFVDRGRYSSEVIYTLIRLAMANQGKVILMRGNHESTSQAFKDGFLGLNFDTTNGELFRKFKTDAINLTLLTHLFFETLPLVAYLGIEGQPETFWIQCCHGGVSNGRPEAPTEVTSFLDSKTAQFQTIVKEKYDYGCNWSDFFQRTNEDLKNPTLFKNGNRGIGYAVSVPYALKFLQERKLKAFFRGHQDLAFGLKMFFTLERFLDFDLKKSPYSDIYKKNGYENGPFYWKDVASLADQNNQNGFLLAPYAPIFTFSSAPEGKGGNRLDFDCFGIFTAGKTYEESLMTIYEYLLNNDRNGKRVITTQEKPDPIHVEWNSQPQK